MKKSIILLSIIFFITHFFPLPLSAKKDKYKRWLNEEVYWLIIGEEEAAFKKLKTDKDKEAFIVLFWAKRDPTPFTEKNEFKDAYYTNLDFVNKKYTRGQEMGWKTNIGKILLFFGLPRERTTNPETWVYDPIPYLKINSEFEIVFDADEDVGLVLNQNLTSKIVLDAMDQYASRTILYPDLKEVPDYSKTLVASSGAPEKAILEKASTEDIAHTDIPFEPGLFFTKAEKGATSTTLVYFFNPREAGMDKAVLFGSVKDSAGKSRDFRREVKVKKDDYYAQVVLALSPGEYDIVLGLKYAQSDKYSIEKEDIDVPNYWDGALALGSLILSDRVENISPGTEEVSAFNFGQVFAFPKQDNVFRKSETLNLFYQIYNASTENNQVGLSQEISLKSGSRTYRLPENPLEREVPEGQVIISGFPIPLIQMEPGEYELIVKITDNISKQIIEKAAKILVVE